MKPLLFAAAGLGLAAIVWKELPSVQRYLRVRAM